jgi:hypothetical protein
MAWTIDRKHDHFAVVTMNTNKVNAQNAAFFGGRARALALSLSMDLTDAAAKGRASHPHMGREKYAELGMQRWVRPGLVRGT